VYFWRVLTDAERGRSTDSLYVARVDRSSGFVPGPPESTDIGTRLAAEWDLYPDGDRYVATYFVVDTSSGALSMFHYMLSFTNLANF